MVHEKLYTGIHYPPIEIQSPETHGYGAYDAHRDSERALPSRELVQMYLFDMTRYISELGNRDSDFSGNVITSTGEKNQPRTVIIHEFSRSGQGTQINLGYGLVGINEQGLLTVADPKQYPRISQIELHHGDDVLHTLSARFRNFAGKITLDYGTHTAENDLQASLINMQPMVPLVRQVRAVFYEALHEKIKRKDQQYTAPQIRIADNNTVPVSKIPTQRITPGVRTREMAISAVVSDPLRTTLPELDAQKRTDAFFKRLKRTSPLLSSTGKVPLDASTSRLKSRVEYSIANNAGVQTVHLFIDPHTNPLLLDNDPIMHVQFTIGRNVIVQITQASYGLPQYQSNRMTVSDALTFNKVANDFERMFSLILK